MAEGFMASFEQKYCIGTKDGKFKILWDISAILNDLQSKEISPVQYCVDYLFKQNGFYGNPEYAMTTDTNKPCIIVELNENIEKMIDGNHRLFKAKQLNLTNIPCYLLPLEYHQKFIDDYDKSVYDKVISNFAL